MSSTKQIQFNPQTRFDWRGAGLRYYSYRYYLRNLFPHRVQKVSIDAGLTCPNVDGTVAVGGCNFCDNRSFSPSRRIREPDILRQIEEGIRRLKWRYKCDHFTAYFQPATNTYADVDRLRPLFQSAIAHPKVVGLAIGTRPDCLPEDILELLADLGRQTYLSVEYGMQTMHDHSLDWMNRGHHHDSMVDAMERSRNLGFEICAHIMLGLPTESTQQMLETAREVGRLGVNSVKIHNLYAVRNTPLGEQVLRGEVQLMERDEYISTLVDFLELLPPDIVVERISGDAPGDYFIGPSWCLDKPLVLKALNEEMQRRGSYQGSRFAAADTPDLAGGTSGLRED